MNPLLSSTLTAFQNGITRTALNAGIETLMSWQHTLEHADFDGAGDLSNELAQLKMTLQSPTPDPVQIARLLRSLGERTAKAAPLAHDGSSADLTALGRLLGQSAEQLE